MTPFAVTLRSGSSGNSALISSGLQHVLVDCGLSLRQLTAELVKFGLTPAMLSAILITHEHSDHIRMLSACSKLEVPVIASGGSITAITDKYSLRDTRVIDGAMQLGGIRIRRFNTSHDAAESCGYVLSLGTIRVGVCTDLGEMTEAILEALYGCDYVVLECNHDVEMLRCGPYPFHLRRRILSRLGHLSNEDCANAVVQLAKAGTRRVSLAHLSGDNNDPALALGAVAWALSNHGLTMGCDIQVEVAPRYEPGEVFQYEEVLSSVL